LPDGLSIPSWQRGAANRWHEKWFALYQNVLFYFESEQSARPAGIYMLEGCSCERAVVKLWLD
uniref:PH domain-containing protein n=1 Tax=Pavo cristatus TaxID=9049 RepID=A0A8C9GAF9_PAVCR